MKRTVATLAILGVGVSLPSAAIAQNVVEASKPRPAVDDVQIALTDVRGAVHRIEQRQIDKALVLVFLNTECPIANGSIPTLNKLAAKWKRPQSGVQFFGVVSDRHVSRKAAVKHANEYRTAFPVLFDASGELADRLKPTHTPEAFVLNDRGETVYRGRIDNAWAELGKRRPKTTRHDLADAVDALCNGRPVKTARTKPVGCLFESTPPERDGDAKFTYSRDVAPIVHAHCLRCHRDGEVAPFPLAGYRDVAKRAGQIAEVVQSGFMPPWKPKQNFGHFVGERRMTQRQKEIVARWAKDGAPEGNPDDLPEPPEFTDGWQLGKPDLVVKMPEKFPVPADGPDLFRNFVIPLNFDSNRFCVAAEFRPGNRRVVHHAIFYLDTSGIARMRDRLDPGPGYGSFGSPGFLPAGDVGGWAPGYDAKKLIDGNARYVPKGSDLVIQVHYHPSGKPETDQSEVGLYFTEKPKNIAAAITVGNVGFSIPAGAKRHKLTASYELPSDVALLAATPHMHLLGREMKVTATLPDGRVVPLIWIEDWNFDWQDQYHYERPIRLPKGTRIDVQGWYDNSSDNPLNPHQPPQAVSFGDASTDEMLFCFFLVSKDDPKELLPLVMDNILPVGREMLGHYLKKAGSNLKKRPAPKSSPQRAKE